MIGAIAWKHKGKRPCLYLDKVGRIACFTALCVWMPIGAWYKAWHMELLPNEEWLT